MSASASRLFYVTLGFLMGVGFNGYRMMTRAFSLVDIILFLALAGLVYISFISLRTWYARRSYVVRAPECNPAEDGQL